MIDRRTLTRRLALTAALLWATPVGRLSAQQTICAVVKLQLTQQAALEREAFNANLDLTNNLGTLPLSAMKIDVIIQDAAGNPAEQLFFIKVNSLTGVQAIDGTGIVQPAGQANAAWLIIPSPGAGGSSPAGQKYTVQARMSFYTGGIARVTTTLPVTITVFPQPLINLEYVLPFEVFSVDPVTMTGSTVPFPLGLRVVNSGSGTAGKFQITSAQPTITDNKQDLVVNFALLGTYLGSTQQTSNSLTIPFGDIPPGGAKQAAWIMTSSLSGRFINFTSTFTHAAELGGALTSLIQSASTYTLIKDVLVDLPDRDKQFDFLINRFTPRSAMEAAYQLGQPPQPDAIMESDRPGFTPVVNTTAHLIGALSGNNGVLGYAFDSPVASNTWVHASIPFVLGSSVTLVSAIRSDGKILDPHNAWIAPHIDKATGNRSYFLHVLDYSLSSTATYALAFNASSLDIPPDPISNLSVSTAGPGAVNLAWTATGEDGSTGTIVGGKYAIFASTDLAATPNVAAAAVVFSTSTPALAPQGYRLSGLLGNATYQIAVFLADAAGHYAPASNRVTARLLPAPPRSVAVVVGTTSAALSWDIGGNLPGVQYNVLLSTSGAPSFAQSGFAVDRTAFVFSGLAVNQTYLVTFQEKTVAAQTPDIAIATATTFALAPAVSTAPFVAVATNAATAQWLAGADPSDTEFFAELSTMPSRTPVLIGGGWVRASSVTFAGLLPATTYYGQVKARNRALVETAYSDLGAIKTAPVDNLPPRTSFMAGSPQFGASPVYVTTATLLNLSAVDDKVVVGDGIGLGVARTLFAIDSTSFTAYSGTFTLVAQGTHTIQFYSVDVLGNTEIVRSTTVAVDASAPIARLDVLGSSAAVAGALFAAARSSFSVTAYDPVIAGAASGVAGIQLKVDGATAAYTAPFALAAGTHTVAFGAFDNLGNGLNSLSTQAAAVDGLPPRTAAAFGDPKFAGARLYLSSMTPILFAATDDLAVIGDGRGSGVGQTLLAVDTTTYAAVVSTVSLSSEGAHFLSWFSRDLVGNMEVAASTSVAVDLTPPLTQLLISTPSVAQASGTVVGPATVLSLSAQDPLSGGVASGVKDTFLAVSTGVFALAPATFTLTGADGPRAVSFYSRDNVLNAEAVKTAAVLLDATPPVSAATIGTPSFVAADGTQYVTPATPVTLTAADPVVNGATSGVDHLEVAVDSAPFAVYTATLTFAEGRHTVQYRAVDRVGNVEATRVLKLLSDNTPPVTAFQTSGAYYAAGGRNYAPLSFVYALPAQDPVVNGVASGVATTLYRVDASSFTRYVSTFTLSEGVRQVAFQSTDNVGNSELLKSATVYVDATAPVTALSIGQPQYAASGTLFVGPAATYALNSQDPVVQGVASGVGMVSVRVDSAPFAAYGATFTLTAVDGVRTVGWFAADNVGNAETPKISTVAFDATPPITSLLIAGGRQFTGPDASTFYTSSDTRLVLVSTDPVVNSVAAGVAVTRWQDNNGAFQTYLSSVTLVEGAHKFGYQSTDNVQNLEVLRSTNAWVDATPPVSAFAFGAPYYQAPDGTNYVTPATPLTFTAKDPPLPSGQPGAGVNRIEVAVDGGAFAVYTSSLTFAEGRHTVQYRSIDNVGNVEVARTLNVQSDATPPLTALAVQGGHQFPGPNAASFFASADTRYALPAVDPVVKNAASGVALTRWQDNGGMFQAFSAPFSLAEGVHHLAYQSQDNVSNLEVLRSTTALVDAKPPVTSLLVAGGRQFPGPDAVTFYASSDTRLVLISTDPVVNGVASGVAFTQYQDNGGAFQVYASSLTLIEGVHKFGYQSSDNVANLEVLRSTNAWIDATPPVTSITIGSPTYTASDGAIYVATATPISFAAADPALPSGQPGSGVARIETSLDGAAFALYATPLTLAEGRHVILYRAIDNVGNVEAAHSISLQSDATPPASSLVIGAPQFQLPNVLLVSSRTPFSVAAVDPVSNNVASGVKDTYYRVSDVSPSTAAFAAFTSSFAMAGADVNKVIEFFSRDNVLNTEVVKSSTVLLDSTPPEIAVLSPAACDSGVCRVLKGKFPVLGTARDLHFGNYVLDYAPGQNAAAGFTTISSGTVAVSSGPLGTWDATKLSGWLTLRLTATDLVQNVSALAINVYIGDPGELLTLGNHEVFDMPEGVAVGADGKIYVADRDNSRVAVFSSTGTLLASFGGRGHDDDDHLSTGTLRLHEPSGVAVDAAGNIYVSDTDRDRVLKLSTTGQVLLSLGLPEREHEERHDDHRDDRSDDRNPRLPGRFHHPTGVAVDAGQNIYVADTDNRRVQVFNSTGGFSLQFDLPLAPTPTERDEDDHDDNSGIANLGKPFGIALDAAGNIYVADPKGGRALKFGATGQLLLTIPIQGDKPGSIGRPFGVAVSTDGECLLVSDRKYSRILKFDFLGAQNLSFGTKGKMHDDDVPAPSGSIVFRKPMGLALDAAGDLFVADRNNDRVREFALPTGRPTLIVPLPKPGDDHVARDVVDKEDGGKVERKDLAAVDIPAGAVPQDLQVTVSTPSAGVADESSRQHAVDAAQLKTASPPVEYGPEGTKFAAPVTLTLPYSPDLVALQGVDEADLTVRYWNHDKAQWDNLDSVVDPKTHTVKAKTTHFSLYQVFSGTASAAGLKPLAAADPTFTFHDAYAFPNPVRGTSVVTIRMQTGLADAVEVHAYDVSGRRVYSSSNFTLNPAFDDGNGKGVQYTYDNVWDISGVGSGVYLYVITAKKAGASDIHKTGRVGVIK